MNDVDVGAGAWNGGFLLSPWEGTRLGVVYFSEIDMKFSGDVDISLPIGGGFSPGIELDIDFAQMVRVGLYQELSDRLAVGERQRHLKRRVCPGFPIVVTTHAHRVPSRDAMSASVVSRPTVECSR